MQIFAGKIYENPIKIIEAFDNESFVEAFSQIEILRKCSNTYLLGYIRYEAKDIFLGKKIKSKYPLLYFEVFDDVKIANKSEKDDAVCSIVKPVIDFESYEKSINTIKEEIANGNTYEVNYTIDYKVETNADGLADGLDFYNSILPRQTTPYNAYIKNKYEEILSFSPELFFELDGNKIRTKPMKGTVKRGETKEEDKKNIEFLENDIKNRAENVMIVDLLRNDLGKIAKTGTVSVDKLFEVETHPTVHQMTSEISAELDKKVTLYDTFSAIFPCGSITGAPKISTMEIIDRVEVGKREVYCGAIGLITKEKAVFSVPIRTLQRHDDEKDFLCRVGGAIVWDSTAEDEWEETQTKIEFLQMKIKPVEKYENNCKVGWAFQPNNNKSNFQIVETILVENGEMKYQDEHFDRMKKSAQRLGFVFNPEMPLTLALSLKEREKTLSKSFLYRILLNKDGSFETQEKPLGVISTNKISISPVKINSKEPLLYHKTTLRPWYDDSMKKFKQGLAFDEIFFNEKGELTEGARSNIILQIKGEFYTPEVKCGLLNGVLRQILIANIAPKYFTKKYLSQIFSPPLSSPSSEEDVKIYPQIVEKKLYLDDLKNAEKIFCINSVRGIVEVELEEE